MTPSDATTNVVPVTSLKSIRERLRIIQEGLDHRPYNRMISKIEERERTLTGKNNPACARLQALNAVGEIIAIGAIPVAGVTTMLAVSAAKVLVLSGGLVAISPLAVPILMTTAVVSFGAMFLAGSQVRKRSSNLDWLDALAEQPQGTTLTEMRDCLSREESNLMLKRRETVLEATDARHNRISAVKHAALTSPAT